MQGQFVPALRASSLGELAAAASRDLNRAEALGPKRAYDSYDALLEDPDVEVVYVATHNGLHHPLGIKAFEKGKHVLCEKPLALNAEQCRELIAAATQHKRILAEAFMYRFHPQIHKALSLLKDGRVGALRTVEASFSFQLTKMDDVRLNPNWGGGGLLDVGCYCVNFCRQVMGRLPVAVTAMGTFHPKHDVDMSIHGVLDFTDGRYGVISCGFDAGLRNRALICGTEGVIHLPQTFVSWEQPPTVRLEAGDTREDFRFDKANVFQLEIEDLARAVRNGTPPLLAVDEGLRNALVLDALRQSARESGRRIEIGHP